MNRKLTRTEKRQLYDYYPTNKKLAKIILNFAEINGNDIVLEPSAGRGNLVLEILKNKPRKVVAVEKNPNDFIDLKNIINKFVKE